MARKKEDMRQFAHEKSAFRRKAKIAAYKTNRRRIEKGLIYLAPVGKKAYKYVDRQTAIELGILINNEEE